MAAYHSRKREEVQGSALSAMAMAPIPKIGNAHPILMRAEVCLRAATLWLPQDLAMESRCIDEVPGASLQIPNFAEKMQGNDILPQKNHGENRNILELKTICVWMCWPTVQAEENE